MVKELLKFLITEPSLLLAVIILLLLLGLTTKGIIKVIKRKDIPIQRKLLWLFAPFFGPLIIQIFLSFIDVYVRTIYLLILILFVVNYDIYENYKGYKKTL